MADKSSQHEGHGHYNVALILDRIPYHELVIAAGPEIAKKNPRAHNDYGEEGVWVTEVPQRGPGAEPCRGSGGLCPQKL